jgi:hypothetical protein
MRETNAAGGNTNETIATFCGNRSPLERYATEDTATFAESPVNHSLISANGNTHIKIAALAIAASLVFVAVVSASATTRTDTAAHAYGPVVKATTLTNVAKTGATVVR